MGSILINGIAAKAGGGKSILVNFLTLLNRTNKKEKFIVIVPNEKYLQYASENIKIISVRSSLYGVLNFYSLKIKHIVKEYDVSLIFNLADFIIPVTTKQVYLFDWPYAIYPDSVVWSRMSRVDRRFRKLKLYLVRHYIHLPVLIIAQTKVAEERLKKYYSVRNVEVIPNAVSFDNLTGGKYKEFNFPKGKIKLLYLTKYYSHKNIEVFLLLARTIREEELPFVLITTIHESQHLNVKRFIKAVEQENLKEVIINVGPVEMEHVPSLYQQSDALLMPSLLESFSGTYVEAMYHGKPIFTSDMDFAKVVCGDTAFYFNPLEPASIISCLKTAYGNPDLLSTKVSLAKERSKNYMSWDQVLNKFLTIIEKYK